VSKIRTIDFLEEFNEGWDNIGLEELVRVRSKVHGKSTGGVPFVYMSDRDIPVRSEGRATNDERTF